MYLRHKPRSDNYRPPEYTSLYNVSNKLPCGEGVYCSREAWTGRVFKVDKLARLVLSQCYLHGHTKGMDKTICHFYGGSVYQGINLAKKKIAGKKIFHVDIGNLWRNWVDAR